MGNFLVPFKKNRTTLKKLKIGGARTKIEKTLSQTHLKGEAPESHILVHNLEVLFERATELRASGSAKNEASFSDVL